MAGTKATWGAGARLANRTMQLQVTVQDGTAWLSTASDSVEITPRRLTAAG